MRFSSFIFLHVIALIILLIVHPHARGDDDGWAIVERSKDYINLTKNGEFIYGDRLIFSMKYKDCDKIYHLFTFLTTKAPDDIHQFANKKIPITLNDIELSAEVIYIQPILNNRAYWVMFELGEYETEKYVRLLSKFFKKNKRYEIALADGLNFEVEKYFDITRNSWRLDKFSEKFAETYKRCKEKTTLKDS